MAKKDYMPRNELNAYIISQYRRGISPKNIERDIRHITIDANGGGRYRKAMLSE